MLIQGWSWRSWNNVVNDSDDDGDEMADDHDDDYAHNEMMRL